VGGGVRYQIHLAVACVSPIVGKIDGL
jgi:hypothetical protein